MKQSTSTDGTMVVSRLFSLPDGFDRILSDAEAEGIDNMAVLQNEWRDGSNRFQREGEILALATLGGEIAGIGGITHDFVDARWLRMRRFYVRPDFRRLGVGRQIALFVLDHALAIERPIALYAGGTEAEAFWPALGFAPIVRVNTTHVFVGQGAT